MEYMALEKPIVQFDLTEGRVSAADASLYATDNDPLDFARQIEILVNDPGLRRKMAMAGQKRLKEQLCWQHSVPHLLAAYEHAFAKAAKRSNSVLQKRVPAK